MTVQLLIHSFPTNIYTYVGIKREFMGEHVRTHTHMHSLSCLYPFYRFHMKVDTYICLTRRFAWRTHKQTLWNECTDIFSKQCVCVRVRVWNRYIKDYVPSLMCQCVYMSAGWKSLRLAIFLWYVLTSYIYIGGNFRQF